MLSPQFVHSASRFWFPTAATFFVNGAIFGGWAAQVPHAIGRLDADEGTFGLMLLGMGIGSVAAMAFSGLLISKYGAGPLVRLTLALFLATYVVLCVASGWPVFVAGLLLFGAAGGLMDVAMNAYAADVEMRMNWRVMASFHGMWSIGGLIGAAAAGWMLAVTSDLVQALVLDAGLAILFLTCQHRLIPLRQQGGKPARRWAVGRMTLVIAALTALCFSAEGAVRDWSSLFLSSEVRADIERAGWGYAAFSATMALCRLSGDWMRLRFGERTVMVASGFLTVIGFVLAVSLTGDLPVAAGFALVGVGLSNVVPILISAAGRTRSPGSSIAFVVSFGYAGYLASPPVLGFIASTSSLATMFLVVAASCVAIPAGWLLAERIAPEA
ncbi:MAG TPA: MFS transporter [Dongiaceae bacterium]|nr:MFS transporter [Dongiaceae bacterium]